MNQQLNTSQSTSPTTPRLMRINAVTERISTPKSSFYASVAKGEFTRPIKLGERSSAWLESEVTAIINARIAGKSSDEIKALVIQLEAQRLNACEVAA